MPSHDDRGGRWILLAKAVRDRRRELGIPTQKAAAQLAGVSQNTWQRLENGTPISMTKLNAAVATLQWQPAYAVAILEKGVEPETVGNAPTDRRHRDGDLHAQELENPTESLRIPVFPEPIELDDFSGSEELADAAARHLAGLVIVPLFVPRDVFADLEEEDVRWLMDAVTRQGRELAATISEARRRARYREQSRGDT